MSTKMHFLVFFNHRHLLIVEMVNYLPETLIIESLLSFSIYLLKFCFVFYYYLMIFTPIHCDSIL